jgi:hypothetical protein
MKTAQRFKAWAVIRSFASKATVMMASRSLRPNEVPLRQAPEWSLNGREKVVAKNGPFSLAFYQIVALMLPQRSVLAGRLDELVVATVFPPYVTS